MSSLNDRPESLQTPTEAFPLHEYHLKLGGRAWVIMHTGAMLTHDDEARFFSELRDRLPYGVALWPAAIGLAHEIAARAPEFNDKRVLELGSGTGLPGIVAASLGGRVVQTDRDELALSICKRNGERNGTKNVEYRLADWATWDDDGRYDWIIGSDILYRETLHPNLRQIFTGNLAPGGRILIADPFRDVSFKLLETLEAEGWAVSLSKWNIGEESAPRAIGIVELAPPR